MAHTRLSPTAVEQHIRAPERN